MAGETEGVLFHANTMIEPDYSSYDAAVKRMKEYGDEEASWL